ncbi:MAG: ATP synthase F1 subunit delta [Firmicutes bacterium]|jgi:F-type H+-transporting ATPase subunit delta|nr:ATP synthase F1 subunit delta [Bacillota bacterium]HBG08814.1 ATP synthase F1 subunit delta [Bacillota bacterium]
MSMNTTRNSQIANRYAKALFLAAGGRHAELHKELSGVLTVLQDPVINKVFYHPRTSQQRKVELVRLMGLSDLLESFLLLVVEKGREGLLPLMHRDFERLVLQDQNTTIAQVTSALELSQEEQVQLQHKLSELTGKKVLLRTQVDPGIGGGLIIQVDGKVLDASVKHRLNTFVHSLSS